MEIAIDTGASLGSEPLTPSADRHQSRRLQYLRKGTGTGGGDYAGYWKKKEETSGKARNRWKDAGEHVKQANKVVSALGGDGEEGGGGDADAKKGTGKKEAKIQ